MEGTIKLEYSVDGGTTWKDPTTWGHSVATVRMNVVTPTIRPEPSQEEPDASTTDAELCYIGDARVYIHFRPYAKAMDLTTTEGQALYNFLCALSCAPLIRLYDNGASAGINGFDEWDQDDNTNYLVPHDAPYPELISTGEDDGVRMDFTLKMKKEYAI